MPRRQEEQAFGSDSFLDIVANVVGILIILIVLVGLRVSRAPVSPELLSAAIEAEAAILAPPPPPPVVALPALPAPVAVKVLPPVELEPLIIDEPAPPPPKPKVIVVERPLPELPDLVVPPALVAQSDSLREALARIESDRQGMERQLAQSRQRGEVLQRELAEAQRRLQSVQSQQERVRADLTAGRHELSETLEELVRLKETLDEAEQEPAATTIQHRVTPLGRTVSGPELHFLLSRGCVSHVPIEKLASRLKLQIERQKEMIAKMDRYEGTIDAVEGFRMQYIVEKSRLSFQEEMKLGQHMVRMQVSQWVLLPEPDLPAETAEEAMRRGSDFYQALLSSGPSTSLTFWVYPDTFETCARLKEFAHRHGYEVAARPLPQGVPITGSPDGSRSMAQ